MTTTTRPALLFWCQHSLGLGHLARAMRLAQGLTAHFDVVLLNGGRFPAGTRIPERVRVVNLPPLGHDASFRLVSHDDAVDVATARDRRRDLILETLAEVAPKVVLIEMYPFGRRKLESELLPLLDAVAAMGPDRPRVVCSLRDILVHERRDQEAYDERVCQRANASFDAILVHADPAFVRLEESFRPRTALAGPGPLHRLRRAGGSGSRAGRTAAAAARVRRRRHGRRAARAGRGTGAQGCRRARRTADDGGGGAVPARVGLGVAPGTGGGIVDARRRTSGG